MRFIKPFAIFFLALFLGFLAESQTDGFRTDKIFVPQAHFFERSEPSRPSEQIKEILDQKFIYLGRGRQCFVFESQDHKYVLKFLNKCNFRIPLFLKNLTFLPFIKHIVERKEKKREITRRSITLTYEKLKDESKILFMNLTPSGQLPKIILKNRANIEFEIDLNRSFFILQQKALLFFEALNQFNKDDPQGLQQGIDAYFDLVRSRISKRIADDDKNIATNIGFVGKEAILIDFGRLYFDENLKNSQDKKTELMRSTDMLRKWLTTRFSEKVAYLDEKIENVE